jgi:hypothetical protein
MTALCKEITGSSGNTATWNKDRVRSDWLREICKKLDISSDYLLELTDEKNTLGFNDSKYRFQNSAHLNQDDNEWIEKINRLPNDLQCELRGYLNRLLEESANREPLRQAK